MKQCENGWKWNVNKMKTKNFSKFILVKRYKPNWEHNGKKYVTNVLTKPDVILKMNNSYTKNE